MQMLTQATGVDKSIVELIKKAITIKLLPGNLTDTHDLFVATDKKSTDAVSVISLIDMKFTKKIGFIGSIEPNKIMFDATRSVIVNPKSGKADFVDSERVFKRAEFSISNSSHAEKLLVEFLFFNKGPDIFEFIYNDSFDKKPNN